jgi:hypothetical protein
VLGRLKTPLAHLRDTAKGQLRYRRDLRQYRRMAGDGERINLMPQLHDRTDISPYDPHYFHQDIWAANLIAELRAERHVDVASRVDLVGFLTALTEVTFVDIRPLKADIERLTCVEGSVLDLPFGDQSLKSLSCLHVAEHIGLGRYGDPLDPDGTRKAAAELQRVLAPGGHLLFSLPVGTPRTEFNAHRVHNPDDILAMFPELRLVEFAGVNDQGVFRRNLDPGDLAGEGYGCGMFHFAR